MIKTINLSFYRLLEGGEVFIKPDAKKWVAPEEVEIIGFQGSISSFPPLHVQAWLIANPEALKQEEVILEEPTAGIFGHINSGSAGTANHGMVFPQGKFISLKKVEPLYLGIWAHNMWSILGWRQKADFHVQYDIYYEEVQR